MRGTSCRTRAGVGAALVALVLPACGGGSNTSASDAPLQSRASSDGDSASSPPGTPGYPVYLEDEAGVSDEDLGAVFQAREELVRACMESAGFHYETGSFTPPPSISKRNFYPAESVVATYGYDVRATSRSAATSDAGPSMTPNEEERFNSCGAQARLKLGLTELSQAQQLLSNAQGDIEEAINVSSEYSAAVGTWQACVAQDGFNLSTPAEALASVAHSSGGFASPEAIRQAVTDYRCRREVRLEETAQAVRDRMVQQWVDDNPGTIESLNSAIETVVAKAK